jgi:ABC-type polysaccharide/polyol phosphate transport system ATPase subunit
MSAEPVISVQSIGKSYVLYDHPEDRLKHTLFWRLGRNYGRIFWALQDISFEVGRGETFGIIGKNGSGKSTLLQMLAGTLQPTVGSVKVDGKVSALLELGSGFNPEYTGRENVFLNGAILGITPDEMKDRFEQIADFAEIGDFIDQPVKLYSSGMFVRLAFAVAAGVDADILLIDEALAVGDIFFRQKCYQRLDVLRKKGTTILLVSHGMNEVEQFCDRALLLNNSKAVFLGSAIEAVKRYYLIEQMSHLPVPAIQEDPVFSTKTEPTQENQTQLNWPRPNALINFNAKKEVSNGWARFTAIALCNGAGEPAAFFEQGETASFFYEVEILHDVEVPTGGVELVNEKGIIVHGKTTLLYDTPVPTTLQRGSFLRFRQDIALDVATGEYTFSIGIATLPRADYAHRADMTHQDLDAKTVVMTILPQAGQFAVTYRKSGHPVQLLHHGVANLPGSAEVQLILPEEHS